MIEPGGVLVQENPVRLFSFFDAAGRQTKIIRNYVDGTVSSSYPDEDVTVETTYNADSAVATLVAKNPTTGDQTTKYIYGTTLSDSAIARADLLRAVIYPDSDDAITPLGDGADGIYDRVEYKYNRQGQRTDAKDQNGSVHQYDFDKRGRLLHDRVTTLATGVDGAVRRQSVSYDVRGLVEKQSSYDNATVGSGSVDNEAQFAYDSFGLLIRDYQEHAGAVNTSTSVKVQYAASDGSAGHVRPTSMTYPNGRVLNVNYGSSGSTEDVINRVGALVDNDGSTHLVDYSYLGAGSFVKADYAEPDIRWDLSFGAGNDPLDGLDRFGRVVDNRWYNYGTSADADRVQYGYDRSGSRTYREQTVDTNSYFDEVYRYDGSDRLSGMDRGPLAYQKTSVSPLKFSQCWGLDATGNWRDFREDSDGANGWNLVQSRTHNGVNEVSDISETTGPAWITPLYDRAGNMTRVPKPSDATQYYSCTYDAWNRLVKLQDGANTVAEYKYDGATRRIIKKSYTAGSLTETRHLYFSEPSQWQVIEERVGSSTAADRQFVWGLRYIDDLLLRDRNADSNVNTGNYGKSGSGLEERLYALQDANWNVTAISNATGTIQERYAYNAYGTPIFLTGSFGARSSSSYDWESLYCGYRYDSLGALYHIRHRTYVPGINWLIRDPIAHDAGDMNLYRYIQNCSVSTTDSHGLIKWNTVKKTGRRHFPWPPLKIGGDIYTVHTDRGTAVAVWRPDDGKSYWCHGYTFDGVPAKGGPFSIYGADVPAVLKDDGWIHMCCGMAYDNANRIAVFWNVAGAPPSHSGKIMSINAGLYFLEDTSILSSKWGELAQNTKSFAENARKYGRYKCYVKTLFPGCCGYPGRSEIPPQ